MSQPNAPAGETLSPQALNAAIQLPPGEPPLPYFNPNAGRVPGAATEKTVEEMLDSLPTATKAPNDPNADPDAALRAQLQALQGEIAAMMTAKEKAAEGGTKEYVFEADDLNGCILLTLSDKSTYMMQFEKTPIVRHGHLTHRGMWRSSKVPFAVASEPGKVEAIVAALKRTEDYQYGRVKDQAGADAAELGADMAKLRLAIRNSQTGAPAAVAQQNVNFEESMRAVPRIAQSPSLPGQRA